MIVTALILDDDEEWVKDIKIAIEGLPESFYKQQHTEITGIKIYPLSDPTKVIEKIEEEKPDIFLIDIELNSSQQGHEIYEDLFVKGIDIRSIAVSAVVNTKEFEKEIKNVGISSIVHKLKGNGSVDERIAAEICRVLNSPETNIDQLVSAVKHCEIESKKITIDNITKTISEFIMDCKNKSIDVNQRKAIFNTIREICSQQKV